MLPSNKVHVDVVKIHSDVKSIICSRMVSCCPDHESSDQKYDTRQEGGTHIFPMTALEGIFPDNRTAR